MDKPTTPMKSSLWMIMNPKDDLEHGYVTRTVLELAEDQILGTLSRPIGNPSGSAITTLDRKGQRFVYLSEEGLVSLDTGNDQRELETKELDSKLSELGELVSISSDHKSKWLYTISKDGEAKFTIAKTTLPKKRTRVLLSVSNLGLTISGNAAWMADQKALLFSGQKANEYYFIRYQAKKKQLSFTQTEGVSLTHWNYDEQTNSVWGISDSPDQKQGMSNMLFNLDVNTGAIIDKRHLLELRNTQIINTTIDTAKRHYIMLYKRKVDYFVKAIDFKSGETIVDRPIAALYYGPIFGMELVYEEKE